MTFETRYSTINALWSGLLIEELWRLGVWHFCIAPGSRSAPLTLACAEHQRPFQCHTHFDERGLGFFALGLSKASDHPVAVITTSGTAVANLFPAVIEARQSGVPLVIISADRPVELIDCGANQAIEQQGIFSGYPAATLNLPTPDLSVTGRWLLTSIDQTFSRSCQQGLPLHINCRFREPLYPGENKIDYGEYLAPVGQWLNHDKPYTAYQLPDPTDLSVPQCWHEFVTGKGVVVVGRVDREEDALPAVQLARSLGWPLLVDVQSQLHGHPETVKHGDLLLASEKGRKLFAEADRLLQIGSYLVSKRLDGFIGQHEWIHHLMLGHECRRLDPGHSQ
ncbi:MAG: 2-succinyl-5-enolpyruvyl-6-hydroxy-3-cyclohexene-1-carboxylic-acid synthase, partial [Endozoicomonas sp.]